MQLPNLALFSFGETLYISIIKHSAILAPLLLFLEETGLPLPLPGDFIIAYLGYRVNRRQIGYFNAFFLVLILVLLGASILYYIAFKWGEKVFIYFGKYVHLDKQKLKAVEKWFNKYGMWVIIFGRQVPLFRVPITFFSGMSQIPYPKFILSTFISVVFWISFYLWLGQVYGRQVITLMRANHLAISFISIGVIFLAILWFWKKSRS